MEFVECSPGSRWNVQLGSCLESDNACPLGFAWNPYYEDCVRVSNCPEDSHWDDKYHVCIEINESNRNDISCPAGTVWKNEYKTCVENDGCPTGSVWNEGYKVCSETYEDDDTTKCSDGMIWREDLGECMPDTVEDGDILECPNGMVWREDLGRCIPDTGEDGDETIDGDMSPDGDEPIPTVDITFCQTIPGDLMPDDPICLIIGDVKWQAYGETCSTCKAVPANTVLPLSLTDCAGTELTSGDAPEFEEELDYIFALKAEDTSANLVILSIPPDVATCDDVDYDDVVNSLNKKSGLEYLSRIPVISE